MRKIKTILIIIIIAFAINIKAQQYKTCKSFQPLSAMEEKALMELPVMTLPANYQDNILPESVDNSQQPYFRPVFNQEDYCCGQASGIGYNFTYEINRLRNLPANVTQNQYPTHFAWNWLNSGYGWYGVSYLHSFQMLKELGTPNVDDYGGTLSFGGPERWMTGYDEYYNGMHNRINNAFQILVDSPEGLLTLKNWIYDHLDGSSVGGVASFYAQYMSANQTLPTGTPEEGKYVLTYFGGSANHAMTIVGYHDSIRYDYNSDGQYTNHIDINNDGVVDMKDWEIGGFKMAQSYGGVPGWGNQGFAYMMYKTLADDLGSGGIWNHSAHILDAKTNCEPQLTIKVTFKHNRRETIKITAGISDNLNATEPDIIKEFHVFNYQGGAMYMQGGWSVEEKKTIEFGLDITDLLTHIEPGQPAKYFLRIHENDDANLGTGEVKSFSLMDYTNGIIEIPCSQTNVPIVENGFTVLSVDATINFDKVEITNTSLPPAPVGQYYSHQMTATGGTPPYRWYLHKEYEEVASTTTFPQVTQQKLNPSNTSDGIVTKNLGFEFPFYDSVYSSVTLHVDGYLMFDEQLYPYPYFNEDEVLFTITRNISPLMTQDLKIYNSQNDGIWYEGNSDYATFRWRAHMEGNSSDEVNFAVTLYPDGKMNFLYGSNSVGDDFYFLSGISDGNDEHYQYTDDYNQGFPASDSKITFNPYDYPEEISLSEEGLLSGTPASPYNGNDLIFRVVDNNFISNYKTLQFSSSGVIVLDSLSSGGDEILDYGDTALISIDVINIEDDPIHNAIITISASDEYVTLYDSTETLGNLPVGVMQSYDDAFEFSISSNVPDGHVVIFDVVIDGVRQQWTNSFIYIAHAPQLEIYDVIVDDGDNGILDPGDSCDIVINVYNNGGSSAYNVIADLICQDPDIILGNTQDTVILFNPGLTDTLRYAAIVSDQAQINNTINFDLSMIADYSYSAIDSFNLQIGKTIEDFETGDFNFFNWGFDGNQDWVITDYQPYEKLFCAMCGHVSHNMESALILDVNVLYEGEITFYKKVSCEDAQGDNTDFLAFFIDDIEQGRWDGIIDWSQETFIMNEGYHRLKWVFKKDNDVSEGMDKVWLDLISLPASTDFNPHIDYDPESVMLTMLPNDLNTDTILINNLSPGNIDYNINISYNVSNDSDNSRSIFGAYMIGDVKHFYTITQYDMELIVFNASDDSEWIKDIDIQFPFNVGLISAENFIGGSGGDLIFNGITGYGVTANWHGEDGSGWGVLKGGETATASISFFAMESMTEDMELHFELFGDIYGNDPHVISGVLELKNLGADQEWLGINTNSGNLPGNSDDMLFIDFNTTGMPDGNYFAEIIISEQFKEETIIPVTLTVDQFMEVDDMKIDSQFEIYPNPFTKHASISWNNADGLETFISILDLHGRTIKTFSCIQKGINTWNWNGRNESGSKIKQGIYFVWIRNSEINERRKIIYLR